MRLPCNFQWSTGNALEGALERSQRAGVLQLVHPGLSIKAQLCSILRAGQDVRPGTELV